MRSISEINGDLLHNYNQLSTSGHSPSHQFMYIAAMLLNLSEKLDIALASLDKSEATKSRGNEPS